jgi:hypothetical protein
MATPFDFTSNLGATIDVTDVLKKVRVMSSTEVDNDDSVGSMLNDGPDTVYIGWNKDTMNADTSQEVDKIYLRFNDSVKIPKRATYFICQTAAGESAKLLVVED